MKGMKKKVRGYAQGGEMRIPGAGPMPRPPVSGKPSAKKGKRKQAVSSDSRFRRGNQ